MDVSIELGALECDELEHSLGFEAIVTLYRNRIFRFMLASVRDVEMAENLTQDCFLRAYQAHRSFRNECKISTWLVRIAVNLLRDQAKNRRLQFWRRLRSHGRDLDRHDLCCSIATSIVSPETEVLARERLSAVWKAAGRLPGKQRTVFLLRFVDDMDIAEIASVLSLTPATVKTHLIRALASVRHTLGETL